MKKIGGYNKYKNKGKIKWERGEYMSGEIILKLNHITKLYPGVTALDDLNIHLRTGEVHAIVGENGAGKSTMIKVISGAIKPTAGNIEIRGKMYEYMTPVLAKQNGIAVIYQEFTLIPVLSAAENIFMGTFMKKGLVLDRKRMEEKAEELFRKLNINIDPKVKVQDLTTGYQQIVEIAKALSQEARILIMDEPSAPLTISEVEAMYKVVDLLKQEGVTIIYISHRMEEIFRLADRVSVLRDGKYIITVNTDETNKQELIRYMVGRELTETYPSREASPGKTVLSLRHLTGNGVKDISFDAKEGEILGIGGLIGAGRTELMQLIFGTEPVESGDIILNGKQLKVKGCGEAIQEGIVLVPEDRKLQGLILDLSVKENTTLPILKKISHMGRISRKAEEKIAGKYANELNTKTPSLEQKVKNLSGGNQQKVVLAKWLAMNPQVLIFDEPTRGIDVGAKAEIYKIMNDLANQGRTILMVSSDMEELIGMSDRVLVLCKGRISGELSREEITSEKIMERAGE